jgi:biopolymer transport protein ExbB
MKRIWNRFSRFATRYWLVLLILILPAVLFAATNVTETVEMPKMSLFKRVFVQGGFFMYLILLLSIGMVYLVVDSFLVIRTKKLMPPDVVEQLKEKMHKGTVAEAETVCEENDCALARIVGAGLRVWNRGKMAIEEALAEHGAREVSSLRTRVSYLNTIATIAPMLGLLGTVSGMIKAFGTIGMVGMGKASELANAISEALLTTAGGLIVAIPAMAIFFFLRDRINSIMVTVEDTIGELIEQLEQE